METMEKQNSASSSKIVISAQKLHRGVLVGTYKKDQDQLKWLENNHLYNYPLAEEEANQANDGWNIVKELWLYSGSKDQRHIYDAEFVGIKPRTEFVTEYPDYPRSTRNRKHGDFYAVFQVSLKYEPTIADSIVFVRVNDFTKRTPKIAQAIKTYQAGGELGTLLDYLPAELIPIQHDQLCVYEKAVQLSFLDTMLSESQKVDLSIKSDLAKSSFEYKYEQIDALSFMRNMPDEKVQLILTSPPYNIGKEYETKTNILKYLAKMKPIINQIARVLKPGGSVCWQVGNYVDNGEVFPLDIFFYSMFKGAGLKLRNRIIWHFGHGLHCKNRFSGRYETILWFTKGDNYVFNLDAVRIPSKYPGKRYYKGDKKGQLSGNPLGKNPEDVWVLNKVAEDWDGQIWDIPNVKSNHPEKVDHPCQFPVELVERCVLALSQEGDIVYDPFVGVGSTIIGALKNRRIGYGTELEGKYIKIGLSRIEDLAQGRLKMRPITQEIFNSEKAGALARIPEEWLTQGNGYENR